MSQIVQYFCTLSMTNGCYQQNNHLLDQGRELTRLLNSRLVNITSTRSVFTLETE